MDPKREMLMHTLATLAYRTARAVEGAPPGFGGFEAGEGARTPTQLLRHMADLLRFTRSLFVPAEPIADPRGDAHDWRDGWGLAL